MQPNFDRIPLLGVVISKSQRDAADRVSVRRHGKRDRLSDRLYSIHGRTKIVVGGRQVAKDEVRRAAIADETRGERDEDGD
ncbi:MAG: hypothetical protein DCC67_10835 [Planctomycetota bacterium]|nr:MAG: hypothetical protein DCC67_10835 [Planctomycetota bacterium]